MDDRTMLELAKEVAYTVCNEIGPVAMCKDPFSFAQEVGVRLIELVKAEENEACAKVCDNAYMARTAADAIRARRNHG